MQRVPSSPARSDPAGAVGRHHEPNFLVEAPHPGTVGIRLAGNDTHLARISREVEHAATVAAAASASDRRSRRSSGRRVISSLVIVAGQSRRIVHRPETIARVAKSIRRSRRAAVPGLRAVPNRGGLPWPWPRRAGSRSRRSTSSPRRPRGSIELALLSNPSRSGPAQRPAQRNFIDDGTRIRSSTGVRGMGDPVSSISLQLSTNHGLARTRIVSSWPASGRGATRSLARLTLMRTISDFREAMGRPPLGYTLDVASWPTPPNTRSIAAGVSMPAFRAVAARGDRD